MSTYLNPFRGIKLPFFLVFCICVPYVLMAQTPVEPKKAEQILQQLGRKVAEVHSLQCSFAQTKSTKLLKDNVQSEGRMVYRQPSELRWEYNKPNDFIFVVKNNQVAVKKDGKTSKLSGQRAKLFKQMSQMMLGTITGEFLNDARSFTTTLYQKEDRYMVYLEPKAKDLKKLFVRFVIELAPTLNVATAVEMHEKKGDLTRIEFDAMQLNERVDDAEFQLQ